MNELDNIEELEMLLAEEMNQQEQDLNPEEASWEGVF